jgi:hypothetical protein
VNDLVLAETARQSVRKTRRSAAHFSRVLPCQVLRIAAQTQWVVPCGVRTARQTPLLPPSATLQQRTRARYG